MVAKPKIWDPILKLWKPMVPKSFDGVGFSRPLNDYTTIRQSVFDPYIGQGSIWTRSVANMPLHTNSSIQGQWMADNLHYGDGFGGTGFNTSVFGTHPIHPIFVDSRIPGTDYTYVKAGNPVPSYSPSYEQAVLSGKIPWPKWADFSTLQDGQDSAVAIIDIGTGIIREYYMCLPATGQTNAINAQGAFTVYDRDAFKNGWPTTPTMLQNGLVVDPYTTQVHYGRSSVVGMHNWLGWIDIASVRREQINHAIAFTCANMAVPTSVGEAIRQDGTRYQSLGPSWPATGGDGDTVPSGDNIPIHGQWAKLPNTLDLSKTGPYPPFVRLVIKAIQTYGMVCTDSNNFVHAFNGEPGFYEKAYLGVDPWTINGDLYKKYSAMNLAEGRDSTRPFDMTSFPWQLTQWAPRNWGKPD